MGAGALVDHAPACQARPPPPSSLYLDCLRHECIKHLNVSCARSRRLSLLLLPPLLRLRLRRRGRHGLRWPLWGRHVAGRH